MKYCTFRIAGGEPTWGVEHDRRLFDLGPTGLGLAPSLVGAIRSEIFGDPDLAWENAPSIPVEEAEFLPVIPEPAKVICIGVNYRSHSDETGRPVAAAPTVFTRFADSQMGHLRPGGLPARVDPVRLRG